MTRFKSILAFFVVLVVGLSCEPDDVKVQNGSLEFAFLGEESLSGGRHKNEISSILVSIRDAGGNFIHERKKVTLYKFGDSFLSEPLALTTGSFSLTEFIVLDPNGNALYATPIQGSPLAYLVEQPLPIPFNISIDQTTKVTPEVIKIEGGNAGDFGYSTFSFDEVETFSFRAGIFAYDATSENFELTEAHMIIRSDSLILFDADLPAITNDIRTKYLDSLSTYDIIVSKQGYGTYEKSFTASELKVYASEPPLVITLITKSLSEGLIAHYPFNGNAEDQTANHFDGLVHGAVLTTDRKGIDSSAFLFDGINDYINVPHDSALNLLGNFTISLWTKVSSNQQPHEGINDILRKWTGNHQGYPFSISYLNTFADDLHEDKIILVRYDGQACGNAPTMYTPTISNDTFLHVVLVKENDKIRYYLNNVLVEEITDTTASSSCSVENTADMTIGCRGNLVRFFKGVIDDIRIYDRALGDSEVGELYGE
jgi:hypothetical protein